MFAPLNHLFRRLVVTGDLVVHDARSRAHRYGDGTGTRCEIKLLDSATERGIAFAPTLRLPQAYMDGRLIVSDGSLYDLLELFCRNLRERPLPSWAAWRDPIGRAMKYLFASNPIRDAKRNVAHHYDIDDAIYRLFLDSDRQYSCAYFEPGVSDLETAQVAKKRHLAAKLNLRPGQRVLDIGCGWGGLSLYLAQTCDVEVVGITLSQEQLQVARRRAKDAGLASRVRFRLMDYRQIDERFERIVSVGMFEHVGVRDYPAYFDKVRSMLTDDGVAVIHSIGVFDGPHVTNPFIAKYIFPGGYIPALSEVFPAIEKSGLLTTDLEILRLHYAETLRHWRERFAAAWDRAVALKGERFCRMWEVYLAGSELAFRYQDHMVFQIQLTRSQQALPLVRDYMVEHERRIKSTELRGNWRQDREVASEVGSLAGPDERKQRNV